MPLALVSPEMRDAFKVTPASEYCPIAPEPPPSLLDTNRFGPLAAIPIGVVKPVTSGAAITAPEVVNALIVLAELLVTRSWACAVPLAREIARTIPAQAAHNRAALENDGTICSEPNFISDVISGEWTPGRLEPIRRL